METLFSSLRDDIQVVKRDLSADLKEVRRNLEEIGNRISAMEDREAGCQEVLHLKEQQIELQAHSEDLENCSSRKNKRIRGVPSCTEGTDLREYVGVLFRHILGSSDNVAIQLDRVHRVHQTRLIPAC
ncbi:hypothetical protein NDU88_002839 [Pleurodeles waltl]|uniref:Uncharacterized protein n=1 Tax=Pleurodeles waltl TaxID=8319 RepID=A0AAV7SEQ1_PLEWA|nr:hypothetical protein NDU88_002839 [Pleurodeles waltl]